LAALSMRAHRAGGIHSLLELVLVVFWIMVIGYGSGSRGVRLKKNPPGSS